VALATVIWLIGAIIVTVVVAKIGLGMLRSVTTPLPPPPPAGELRKVDLRYRCSVCGMEIRLTKASEEDPEPPRHCQEEMDLVAPVE
jgi:hypothetical protein